MPQVRIRVALFKGQESIELARLTSLPNELSRLFRFMAEDAGVLPVDNKWRASNFSDGSLEFNAITHDELSRRAAMTCTRIANAVFSGKADSAYAAGVSDRTLLQYGRVAKEVEPGETICLGAYRSPKAKKAKLYPVTADAVKRLTETVRQFIEYHGSVLGVVHAFYKEADRPHFDLRDIARGDLIKVYYRPEHYETVIAALAPRERRVHVSGMVKANRLDKSVDSINLQKIELVEPMTELEFERFFGSLPALPNNLSAEEAVAAGRDDDY